MPHFLLESLPPDKQWVIYGVGGLALMYLFIRRMGRKNKKDPLADAPVRFPVSQQRAVEREMQSLLVELSEMARQTTAQLDTRAAKLELLLQEADQKIAELRALTGGDGRSLPNFGVTRAAATPPPAEEDPRHAEVYRLADQGKTASQIAHELGRHSGEIELILALRGKAS
jgi:hypothetical protein